MENKKKIFIILGILVILVIIAISSFVILNKKDSNVDNVTVHMVNDDYSIEKAMSKNALSNLIKDTGYLSFTINPVAKDSVKKTVFYAYDNYMILKPSDGDDIIVTDKSSLYRIKSDKIENYKKLDNYDMNSFVMDIRLHDVHLESSVSNGIITDRFMSNNQHSKEIIDNLNDSFPEVYNIIDEYDALYVAYFFDESSLELKGYNLIGFNPDGNDILYVMNNISKEIQEEDKNNISKWLDIVKNYKE